MKFGTSTMERALAYRAWQAPFAERKLAPLLAHNDLGTAERVLDVGCGPGTNTHHFTAAGYLGVDVNERYITHARRRHRRSFLVADVTTECLEGRRFDCILVNSLFHHLDDDGVKRTLAHLTSLLDVQGYVHILDLVVPPKAGIARSLARWDRGDFPRPLDEWRELFTRYFDAVVFEPYRLTMLGATLWHMVYFKGRTR